MKFKSNIEAEASIILDGALTDASGSPGSVDQILSSTVTGTAWIDPSTIVSEAATLVVIACKNTSGAAIAQGTPVYQTGTVGATATIEIAPADALISENKLPAIGLLQTALNNDGFGFVVITGELTNFTTSPIDGVVPTTGDKVFVKSGGGLTLIKPTGEGNGIQNMGLVGKVSGGNSGSITVSSIMRTNDVPNLPEGRIWVGDGNTIVSDTVYVDEPNNRVGIGTDSPDKQLTVGDGVNSSINVKTAFNAPIWEVEGMGTSNLEGYQGMFYQNTKTVQIRANGDSYFNGGDVGIGTDSPSTTLDVNGIVTATGGNSTQWNTAYDNSITTAAVTGTTTKTLTLTQQDAGTITTSWTDNNDNTNYYTTAATFNTADGVISFSGAGGQPAYSVDLDGRYAYSSDLGNYLPLTGGTLTGGLVATTIRSDDLFAKGMVRATGWYNTNTGNGTGYAVEIGQSGGSGYILSYSRDAAAYQALNIVGTYTIIDNSVRSPIFYDKDNTGYYLDPSASSSSPSLKVAGNIELTAQSSGWSEGLRINVPNASTWGGIRVTRGSGAGNWALGYTGLNSSNDFTFYSGTTNTIQLNLDHSANLTSIGSMRSPIFYDSNNTGYYVNPASQSYMSTINFGGILNGNGHATIGRNHAYDTMELRGYGSEMMIGSQGTALHINYRTCNSGAANNTPTDWYWRAGSSSSYSNHYMGDIHAATSSRAPIFYDSNNTGYYLDPAGTSNLSTVNIAAGTFNGALNGNATTATTLQTARNINNVAFNGGSNITIPTIFDTGYRTITNPGGGTYTTTASSVTGAIEITLPSWQYPMVRMTIQIYEYTTNEAFTVYCGGHTSGTLWYNEFAYIVGNPGIDRRFNVRFGRNAAGLPVIYIGETGSVWTYPQVFVTDLQVGYGSNGNQWTSGWNVGFRTAALENVSRTVYNCQVGYTSSSNIGNANVLRDASGNFSAGTVTATLNGNATTATNLTSGAKTISGNLTVGNTTSSNIYMVDTDEGNRTIHCNSNRIGFLTSGGSWGSFCGDNGDWTTDFISYAGGSMRAPIFYDSNNTGYYLDPTSDSNLYRGKFRANDQANNNYTLAALWTQNYNSGPAGIAFHISGNVGKLLEMRTNGVLYWENSQVLTTTSGKATDSNLLDGVDSSQFLRSDTADSFSGTITMATQKALVANNYGRGVYGLYNSTRFQHVWSMGTAYNLADNGTSTGNLYGLTWSYPSAGGAAANLNTHGLMVVNNGSWEASLASSTRARLDMRAPIFYDSNNTGYYTNPASTSNLNQIDAVITNSTTVNATTVNATTAQVTNYNVNAGDGNGLRFWSSNSYKISMGNTSEYHYGPVTDYSIRTNMSSNTGRGFTWGIVGSAPTAGLSNTGYFQIAGTMTASNFILSSDERKKTKIKDLSCDNIDTNWKSFEMKNNEGEYRVGVIAQELEVKHPEFVNTDNEGFKSVKYIDLLIAKIAELEARLEKAGL